MKDNSQVYKCPKCQKNTMYEKDVDGYSEYNCESCGYNYKVFKPQNKQRQIIPIFALLEKYAWVLSVVALVLAISMYPIISGQVSDANARTNYVGNSLQTCIDENSDYISGLNTNVTVLKNNLNSMDALLNVIEINVGKLIGLDVIVSNLRNNITSAEEDISKINEFLDDIEDNYTLESSFGKLDFTFYQNQTNVTNYCHLNVSVENDETDLVDVKFGVHCEYTNISLMEWGGFIKPQEYQWVNGSYMDNYYLQWFERGKSFYAIYNITWSFSDYNSTQLDTGDIKENIMVNSFLVDDIDVLENVQ